MDTSKLKPNDPRVKYETTQVRGKTYSYILGEPQGTKVDTIFLIHGWPDMAFGWRCQIPYLMSLGFQVVAPNMVGYAGTDAPEDIKEYSFESVCADIVALAREFVGEKGQIVLGGHDWGGAIVWRVAYYYPELIKAVFSVCTPLNPINTKKVRLENIIAAGGLPNFKYQLQLGGPDVQARIQGKDMLRKFLLALFGARGPGGETGFTTSEGVLFDNLDKLRPPLLLDERELEHYVEQYSLHGPPEMRGPLNWYRTREINSEQEAEYAKKTERPMKYEMPALFISASRDSALPPAMAKGMGAFYTNLTQTEVNASHWALVEAGHEVNRHIAQWLDKALSDVPRSVL